MSRDMMPHFELYQPDTLENAIDLARRIGKGAWFLAGGNDSLDWFKDRHKRPTAVIEISGIASLKGIRETEEGLEIGALTTLADIESSPLVREKYSLLSTAAGRVASPQIRNSGTHSTAPHTRRMFLMVSPSINMAAATLTSAKSHVLRSVTFSK